MEKCSCCGKARRDGHESSILTNLAEHVANAENKDKKNSCFPGSKLYTLNICESVISFDQYVRPSCRMTE